MSIAQLAEQSSQFTKYLVYDNGYQTANATKQRYGRAATIFDRIQRTLDADHENATIESLTAIRKVVKQINAKHHAKVRSAKQKWYWIALEVCDKVLARLGYKQSYKVVDHKARSLMKRLSLMKQDARLKVRHDRIMSIEDVSKIIERENKAVKDISERPLGFTTEFKSDGLRLVEACVIPNGRAATLKSPQHKVNEDAIAGIDIQLPNNEPFSAYVICDGQGGADAVKYVVDNILQNLSSQVILNVSDLENQTTRFKVLNKVYYETNQACKEMLKSDENKSGTCTATVVMKYKDMLTVANVGDTRAMLLHGKTIVPLTLDQKVSDPRFVNVVTALGGKISKNHRISGLALPMALGGLGIKGLCAEPVITTHKWQKGDLLVLATDGLTKVASTEEIGAFLLTNKKLPHLVKYLVAKARNDWNLDDITGGIVSLS